MLVQTIRKNVAKQKAPVISVVGGWCGHEPFAVYSLNHRKPTEAEIASAIAEWKRDRDKQRAKQDDTLKPSQGAGEEETDQ